MDKNPEQKFINVLQGAARIAEERFGASRYNTYHLLLSLLRVGGFARELL